MVLNKYIKILIIVIGAIYGYKCAGQGRDFEVFVNAGEKIIHGQDIYFPPFAQNLQYYYSPLFALLLAPFSKLPIMISQLLWISLSYFLLVRIWKLSVEYFDTSQLSSKQMQIWLLIALLLSRRFIWADIVCVQMTVFLLWATLQSLQLIKRKKYIMGGALLALAINIKLLPLAFVFYLIYRNELKAAFFSGLFYLLYLFVPALYLGWQKNLDLIHEWFTIINPLNKEWTIESEDGPSSLVALIPVYLTDTTGVLSFKRNFINLPYNQVFLILNFIRLAFICLTLVFLRSLPFKAAKSYIQQFWEMCYLFIVIPLIYPHQQQYAFLYIIPAFIYLSYFFVINWELIKRKMNIFLWVILAIAMANFSPIYGRELLSSNFCEVLLYFRILPMAVIALIPILWICRPKSKVPIEIILK